MILTRKLKLEAFRENDSAIQILYKPWKKMALVWYKWWVLWEPKPEFRWSGVQICNTPGQVHVFFECHLNLPHVINSTSNLVEPLSVLGGEAVSNTVVAKALMMGVAGGEE